MKVRQLERLLTLHDAPASFLDTVTRALRSQNRLPVGGRGINAPEIGPDEAAWILVSLAATDVAAKAGQAFARQVALRIPMGLPFRHANHFVDCVQVILGDPDLAYSVWEIRVGRSHPHSQIVYRDGHVEHFVSEEVPAASARNVGSMAFRSEGILSGGLLHQVAIDLAEEANLAGLD